MHGQATASVDTKARTRPVRATYLPGLDGLRAFAVLAVLAYHFHVPMSVGGFLGVDIFFVLSGYLISSQLWARWSVRGVDLKSFWLGRLRRLLPAVIALIAVCTVLMLLLGQDQLGVFVGDVGAAATYTSNWWYILHERSYFEASGRPPVLQHLWSLAVEEQFYLLWPVLVAFVMTKVPRIRARQQILAITSVVLAGISAMIMGLGSAVDDVPGRGDPSRWYFGTDSHASGLLLGAALAFYRGGAGFGALMPMLAPVTRRVTIVGSGCLALLLAAVCFVDEFSVPLYRFGFPIVALATVVLVAVVSREGPLQRLFSTGVLRYIGQRSYGLYLWHWPVASFTRPDLDLPYGGVRVAVLRIMLTFVLAELSFQLVERPIRRHGWSRPWTHIPWSFTMARLAVLQSVVGLTVAFALPPRLGMPAPQLSVAAPEQPAPVPRPTPSLTPEQVTPRKDLSLVVYGDSVAVGAGPALVKFFGKVENRAQVAEHSWNLLPGITTDAAAGKITADVVLIHTGDNGIIPDDQLKAALESLKHIKSVIVTTPKVPRPWERRSVETVRRIAPGFANVQVADWHAYASANPAWFVADGVHLSVAGKEPYARLVLSQVTIPAGEGSVPPAPPPSPTATPATSSPPSSPPGTAPGAPAAGAR